MLHIANLRASIAGKTILNGLYLDIAAGEVHAIMGSPGSRRPTAGAC